VGSREGFRDGRSELRGAEEIEVTVLTVLERALASLRGELNRWMLEIRSGVFVGILTQSVR
jgi:hypothetical protein